MTDNADAPQDPIPSDLVREDVSFADIVQQFVNGLPNRVQAMEKAFSEGDFESLRRAAHQLKGSGGGHGYAILTQLARQLEQNVLNGDLQAARCDVDELKILISRVVVRLD